MSKTTTTAKPIRTTSKILAASGIGFALGAILAFRSTSAVVIATVDRVLASHRRDSVISNRPGGSDITPEAKHPLESLVDDALEYGHLEL